MSAGTYKITADQGATFELVLTWRDPSGNPINLTGYAARMRVAPSKGAPQVLSPSTENGQITLGGSNGQITVRVSAAIMATVPQAQYAHELDVESPDGTVTRLIEGPFVCDGMV